MNILDYNLEFRLKFKFIIALVIILATVCSSQSHSQCSIVWNSNARGDDDHFLLIADVESVGDCCSILASNPDYNVFVYCPNQPFCFNTLNPQDNIPPKSCYLKYQINVAQGKLPNVFNEGSEVDFVSGHILFKSKGWSQEVNNNFSSMVWNRSKIQLIAKYIFELALRSAGFQNIVSRLEKIINAGGCDLVFQILQEMNAMAKDEQTSIKLQDKFSGSQTIFECARDTTVANMIEAGGFTPLNKTVAPQDPCREVSNCIFLMQTTRFLLNLDTEQICNAQRVCRFLGFQQIDVCQRECEFQD